MDNRENSLMLCPLCEKEKKIEKKAKVLYGVTVCRGCYYKLANLRQMAFLVDLLILRVMLYGTSYALGMGMAVLGLSREAIIALANLWGYLSYLVFCFKDGFGGYSPGKALMGLQVVDQSTGEPATFAASFKRNLILIVPIVPLFVAIRLCKGYRWGDSWANTKVIWKKYQNKEPFAAGSLS